MNIAIIIQGIILWILFINCLVFVGWIGMNELIYSNKLLWHLTTDAVYASLLLRHEVYIFLYPDLFNYQLRQHALSLEEKEHLCQFWRQMV